MVKKIQLTRGKFALIDDEDFDRINCKKWYTLVRKAGTFAAVRTEIISHDLEKQKRKTIYMHRVIMGAPEGLFVDHINHNPLDNRKVNLRIVTNRQNCQNLKDKGNSKFPGVRWVKDRNKWRTLIQIDGKRKHLGYFNDEKDAAKAYEQACIAHGEEVIDNLENKGDS